MNHFLEQANLDEAGQYRKEQPGCKAEINERRAPDVTVNLIDELLHAVPH